MELTKEIISEIEKFEKAKESYNQAGERLAKLLVSQYGKLKLARALGKHESYVSAMISRKGNIAVCKTFIKHLKESKK